jgi:hypothetical protein
LGLSTPKHMGTANCQMEQKSRKMTYLNNQHR